MGIQKDDFRQGACRRACGAGPHVAETYQMLGEALLGVITGTALESGEGLETFLLQLCQDRRCWDVGIALATAHVLLFGKHRGRHVPDLIKGEGRVSTCLKRGTAGFTEPGNQRRGCVVLIHGLDLGRISSQNSAS